LARFVVASSVSLAPAPVRELVRFAAPPLPKKPGGFSGYPDIFAALRLKSYPNRTAIQFSRVAEKRRPHNQQKNGLFVNLLFRDFFPTPRCLCSKRKKQLPDLFGLRIEGREQKEVPIINRFEGGICNLFSERKCKSTQIR